MLCVARADMGESWCVFCMTFKIISLLHADVLHKSGRARLRAHTHTHTHTEAFTHNTHALSLSLSHTDIRTHINTPTPHPHTHSTPTHPLTHPPTHTHTHTGDESPQVMMTNHGVCIHACFEVVWRGVMNCTMLGIRQHDGVHAMFWKKNKVPVQVGSCNRGRFQDAYILENGIPQQVMGCCKGKCQSTQVVAPCYDFVDRTFPEVSPTWNLPSKFRICIPGIVAYLLGCLALRSSSLCAPRKVCMIHKRVLEYGKAWFQSLDPLVRISTRSTVPSHRVAAASEPSFDGSKLWRGICFAANVRRFSDHRTRRFHHYWKAPGICESRIPKNWYLRLFPLTFSTDKTDWQTSSEYTCGCRRVKRGTPSATSGTGRS